MRSSRYNASQSLANQDVCGQPRVTLRGKPCWLLLSLTAPHFPFLYCYSVEIFLSISSLTVHPKFPLLELIHVSVLGARGPSNINLSWKFINFFNICKSSCSLWDPVEFVSYFPIVIMTFTGILGTKMVNIFPPFLLWNSWLNFV